MPILQSIITVRQDASLERAVASEVQSLDDKDLTESFLDQMSRPYHPEREPSNEGQDIAPDNGDNQ